MSEPHTHQTVHDIVQGKWESDLPDKVLLALLPHDGKPLTKRIEASLAKALGGEWRLRREYGMTHIENREYQVGNYKAGVSLLIDWRVDSFPFDVSKLRERNTAYFIGREERNHARMELMNTKERLDKVADAMNRITDALAELADAKKQLSESMTMALSSDQYDVERACGYRDAKGERVRL